MAGSLNTSVVELGWVQDDGGVATGRGTVVEDNDDAMFVIGGARLVGWGASVGCVGQDSPCSGFWGSGQVRSAYIALPLSTGLPAVGAALAPLG